MDTEEFWDLVNHTYVSAEGQIERQTDLLADLLVALDDPERIVAFQSVFDSYLDSALTGELWGAAALIEGGYSAEGFRDFRCWLISRGRVVYELVVADPESLADLDELDPWGGDTFGSAARYAYERATGSQLPEPAAADTPAPYRTPFEDLARRYPRLAARVAPGADELADASLDSFD
ncbi:DUF4240 domain-containing protein [Allonocardiopsis opalescens]|uniref:Uncharacterized protein DUF4240 n=1 Tax=Allonocardiopsis opalescens TaxID=1144618 RepID=A0A2T0Q0K8_9ACTN|nr:DUF4240 domain-containing protein [Allonocardiopsis opalescens]PRX97245.1 uncharacterized protein DUF4240 [Allonocardiopsis opalescens]